MKGGDVSLPAPASVSERESVEVVKHLWDVWQYRHSFFWNALIRWGAAIVFVSAIPHLKPQFMLGGAWVLMFPGTAIALTLFSSVHLIGEHQRLVAATKRYLECCGEWAPPRRPEHVNRPREFTFATGIGVVIVYFVSLLALSAVNAAYLVSESGHTAAAQLLGQSKPSTTR